MDSLDKCGNAHLYSKMMQTHCDTCREPSGPRSGNSCSREDWGTLMLVRTQRRPGCLNELGRIWLVSADYPASQTHHAPSSSKPNPGSRCMKAACPTSSPFQRPSPGCQTSRKCSSSDVCGGSVVNECAMSFDLPMSIHIPCCYRFL